MVPVIQMMFSINSLAVLNVGRAVKYLSFSASELQAANSQPNETAYLSDVSCIDAVNSVLFEAAGYGLSPATPALLAWSVIALALKTAAATARVGREQRTADVEHPESERGASGQQSSTGQAVSIFDVTEDALELIMNVSSDEDPIAYMAQVAVDESKVHEVLARLSEDLSSAFAADIDRGMASQARYIILDLIRESLYLTGYCAEAVEATLAVYDSTSCRMSFLSGSATGSDTELVRRFLEDDEILLPGLLEVAQERYPYETTPYLRLCAALITTAAVDDEGNLHMASVLENEPSLTQMLPNTFQHYELIREDENANCVRLVRDFPLFTPRNRPRRLVLPASAIVVASAPDKGSVSAIPLGTPGTVIRDSRPLIVRWAYHHSALRYLKSCLSSALTSSDCLDFAKQAPVELEVIVEAIRLYTRLLISSVQVSDSCLRGINAARRILENINAGDAQAGNSDIITIIFDIFDQTLQQQSEQPGSGGSLEILVNCTRFAAILTVVEPNRVWPFLARGRLLNSNGGAGSLVAILTGTEMLLGRYSLLLGCIAVFEALVEDAVTNSVIRKGTGSRSVTRFESSTVPSSGASERVMSEVLVTFARILVGVLESCSNWKFVYIEERYALNTNIARVFETLIRYTYGVDDSPGLHKKLIGVLAPAAEYLLDVFLSASANDLPTQPIISILIAGTSNAWSTIFAASAQALSAQTRAALSFATTLLRVSLLLDRPSSHMEAQLFKVAPVLARLFASNAKYKRPVAQLFGAMIRSAGRTDEEPPSLLGHLGSDAAKSFLSMISDLGQPLDDSGTEIDIWDMLSAVVSGKQQWFAIYVLTGKTPRDDLKTKGSPASIAHRSLLRLALSELSNIGRLKPRRALAMLQFVALAQNHWLWAMNDISKHPQFLKKIMDFIGSLAKTDDNNHSMPERTVNACNELHIASVIAEILAMYLHRSRQTGDTAVVRDLIPKLSYLKNHGVSLPRYNASLHTMLKKNFRTRFPGCSLHNFKRTLLEQRNFGTNYFYDLDFASRVLRFDQSWAGRGKNGFAEEFKRANMNLSLVEAQILLLKGWKLLAVELSGFLSQEPRLSPILGKVVDDCLRASAATDSAQSFLERLEETRVDFAFVLTQKLVDVKTYEPEVMALLTTAWDTMRSSSLDFDTAFAGDQADYYRSLLKILFLTIQPHVPSAPSNKLNGCTQPAGRQVNCTPGNTAPAVASELLEILAKVVAKGFHSLSNQLHEDPQSCSPSDFVLLAAVLQSILRIPGVQMLHSQIALLFSNNNTSRYAISLFSWADQLAVDRDPIFGELSILFLLELSSIPLMAETLAIEGVLSQLSTANLMNYFRRPNGVGPFDEPSRMYSVWTRGILPLCLNLLDAVGVPIAAEIASFLNQFPTQLSRLVNALMIKASPKAPSSSANKFSLSMASETHLLALITLVLERYRTAGAGVGVIPAEIPQLGWDKAGVKEDLEGWIQGRRALKERIVPASERETELARLKPLSTDTAADSRLEERIVAEFEAALRCLSSDNGP